MRLEGAACAGHPTLPPSTWDHHINGEAAEDRRDRVKAARKVCADCPVAEACGDAGLRGYGGGTRNGHTYPDHVRTAYSLASLGLVPSEPKGTGRRSRPPCGSSGGRKAHLSRGEDVCDPCDEAARAANRERMALTRATERGADVA